MGKEYSIHKQTIPIPLKVHYQYSPFLLGYRCTDDGMENLLPRILNVESTTDQRIRRNAPFSLVKDVPSFQKNRMITGLIPTNWKNLFFGDYKGGLLIIRFVKDDKLTIHHYQDFNINGIRKRRNLVSKLLQNPLHSI